MHAVHTRLILASGLWLMAAASPVMGATPPMTPASGTLIERVTCADDSEQSYALYLPANYTADRAWPIVYCFDPGARGHRPVEKFQQAAELYGYIIVGSNNSRNSPRVNLATAANPMLRDTHQRFRIDDRRLYAAGLSGGARVACSVALAAHFAGVIACSGSFADGGVPPQVALAFFGSAGREDFNYQEMKRVAATLAAQHTPQRLVIFAGGHEWLPAPVAAEALEWLELQAMRLGLRRRDDALTGRLLQKRLQAVGALKNEGEAYLGWLAIVSDFDSLADTAEPAAKAAALKDSKPVRQYFKAEKKALQQEDRWIERLQRAAEESRHPAPRPPRSEILSELRRQSGAENPPFSDPNAAQQTPGTEYRQDAKNPPFSDPNLAQQTPGTGYRQEEWLRPNLDRPAAATSDADRYAALRDAVKEVRRQSETNVAARRALNSAFAAYFEQGRGLVDAESPDGAVENLQVAAIIRPEVPATYFELARAYALRGDRGRARELLETALAKGFQDEARVGQLRTSLNP
jgi:tetratricopeptide (TPR) repeat protein